MISVLSNMTNAPHPVDRDPSGLSSAEAARRLEHYGPNNLPETPLPGVLQIFARQFLSPFIYILLVAALVSLALAQIPNAIFIFAVLLLNAAIGSVQEYSAQKSAAALRNMVRGQAQVIRDGSTQKIDIEFLVPGDVVLLASGDKVPADLELLSAQELGVDESMLTGESMAVEKSPYRSQVGDVSVAERYGDCFAGTIVTHGRGRGLVVATGQSTQLGLIADQVTGEVEADPPLVIRIRRFTYQVAGIILIAIATLLAMMVLRGGYDLQSMSLMVVGLAVSTIPEGLPAALTVALAIGMNRMAKHNVIIRKLVAVEALGSCTFICSDKTGTLTVNELTIRRILLPDGSVADVSGEGVNPGGEIGADPGPALTELCVTGVLANESHLDYAGGEWTSHGDIVDVAFLVLAKKLGLSLSSIRDEQEREHLIPYESEKAFSGSINRQSGELAAHVKGSPEKVLSMCNRMLVGDEVADIDEAAIEAQFTAEAARGYRIIALGRRSMTSASTDDALTDMVFLGMVAMIDPVRPEAREALERCRTGGVEVAMVTGDHPATARAIAIDLGLCDENDDVVSGAMIQQANARGEFEADDIIRSARVFARIAPEQKRQIVESLMRAGHFVAVTGDGVNDAPAMHQSHVGVAMGKRGTDVAKEAAEIIITDDNFASIVDGIEQGRIVYNNIRKVIALLVATGFSALLLFFLTVAAGLPMPLLAVQLLWLNLIANGVQDVALAFEPKEGGELARPPRSPREPIFDRHIIEHVLVAGGIMGALAFLVFAWLNYQDYSIEAARNLTLMLMVLFGNVHALSSRSETRSLLRIRFFSNPFLVLAVPAAQLVHIAAMYVPGISSVLGLSPIALQEWLGLAAVALLFLAAEETHKWILRRRERGPRHGTP
ncbi:MAG: HAD-IC family P-type ATPase [Gammaproteobacteria bacterium]